MLQRVKSAFQTNGLSPAPSSKAFDVDVARKDFISLLSSINGLVETRVSKTSQNQAPTDITDYKSEERKGSATRYPLYPTARTQIPQVPISSDSTGKLWTLPAPQIVTVSSRYSNLSRKQQREILSCISQHDISKKSESSAAMEAEARLFIEASVKKRAMLADQELAAMNPLTPQVQKRRTVRTRGVAQPASKTDMSETKHLNVEVPLNLPVVAGATFSYASTATPTPGFHIGTPAMIRQANSWYQTLIQGTPLNDDPNSVSFLCNKDNGKVHNARNLTIGGSDCAKWVQESLTPKLIHFANIIRNEAAPSDCCKASKGPVPSALSTPLDTKSSNEEGTVKSKMRGLRRSFRHRDRENHRKEIDQKAQKLRVESSSSPRANALPYPIPLSIVEEVSDTLLALQSAIIVASLMSEGIVYSKNDIGLVGLDATATTLAMNESNANADKHGRSGVDPMFGKLTDERVRGVQSVVMSELLNKEPDAQNKFILEDHTIASWLSRWIKLEGNKTPIPINLHALRVFQRVSSEVDFLGASTVRIGLWADSLRIAVAGFAHDPLLQRLLIAGILLTDLQTSSLASRPHIEKAFAAVLKGESFTVEELQTDHMPEFNKTLCELASLPVFSTSKVRALWEEMGGVPSGANTATANSVPSKKTSNVSLLPPPVLPPMPFDQEACIFPSLNARPFPNVFANRTSLMESARQTALAAADAEWANIINNEKKKNESGRRKSGLFRSNFKKKAASKKDEPPIFDESVLKALTTLETLEVVDKNPTAGQNTFLPLPLHSLAPAFRSSTAAWRYATNTDSFATYYTIMHTMHQHIGAVKIESARKTAAARQSRAPDATRKNIHVNADVEAALSKMATPKQIQKAVTKALREEVLRRKEAIAHRSKQLEEVDHDANLVHKQDQSQGEGMSTTNEKFEIPHYWPDFLKESFLASELSSPLFAELFADEPVVTNPSESLLLEFKSRVRTAATTNTDAVASPPFEPKSEANPIDAYFNADMQANNLLLPLTQLEKAFASVSTKMKVALEDSGK